MDIYALLPLLSPDERTLIEKHHDFYKALISGKLPPSTPAQRHFIEACNGLAHAETTHEKAFIKFRALVQAERERRWRETQNAPTRSEGALEENAGTKAYPQHMAKSLDDAADWAAKNGFRLPTNGRR